MKRHSQLSLILFLLLVPMTARGDEPVIETQTKPRPAELFESITLGPQTFIDYTPVSYDLLNSITMRRLPPGSLYVNYDGFHGVVVKHLRGQYRRFTRRAARKGWLVQEDDYGPLRGLYERQVHTPVNPQANGEWWQRRWFESLPPEKGGAPAEPYVHTYGEEVSWKYGPVTVTNTLKLRFDYIAFFELNPEPVSHDHSRPSPRVSFDVQPARGATVGTRFRFNVKPRVRIGMPESGDLLAALRGASLQASFEIYQSRKKVVEGEAEIKWRPDEGLIVTLEIELVSW